MKKNIGNTLALYPTPAVVVGTEVRGKVNWLLVAHVGIIGHDRIMLSMFKKHYTNEGVFPRHAAFSCQGIVSLLSLCVFLPAAHPVLLQACAQWHPHTRASLRLRIPGWRAGRPCPG